VAAAFATSPAVVFSPGATAAQTLAAACIATSTGTLAPART